mmetsp:Transcript_69609/g.181024  ORF Transcript_69609/g.181024 Transcript_69609/m.181024 type:complete len:324 (-) Transcript_69609:362-1333(-)
MPNLPNNGRCLIPGRRRCVRGVGALAAVRARPEALLRIHLHAVPLQVLQDARSGLGGGGAGAGEAAGASSLQILSERLDGGVAQRPSRHHGWRRRGHHADSHRRRGRRPPRRRRRRRRPRQRGGEGRGQGRRGGRRPRGRRRRGAAVEARLRGVRAGAAVGRAPEVLAVHELHAEAAELLAHRVRGGEVLPASRLVPNTDTIADLRVLQIALSEWVAARHDDALSAVAVPPQALVVEHLHTVRGELPANLVCGDEVLGGATALPLSNRVTDLVLAPSTPPCVAPERKTLGKWHPCGASATAGEGALPALGSPPGPHLVVQFHA